MTHRQALSAAVAKINQSHENATVSTSRQEQTVLCLGVVRYTVEQHVFLWVACEN
jgi:hypothetical protein